MSGASAIKMRIYLARLARGLIGRGARLEGLTIRQSSSARCRHLRLAEVRLETLVSGDRTGPQIREIGAGLL